MLRHIIYCCTAILLIACTDSGEIATNLLDESNDTTEQIEVIKSCDFINNREGIAFIDSTSIQPQAGEYIPDNSQLLDSATYNKYLKDNLNFHDDFDNYKWITARKVKGAANNLLLVSYIKKDEFKDRDTYIIAFSNDCKILDKLLVASFQEFNGGSTQKSTMFVSDTFVIGTLLSNKTSYSLENNGDINYRRFYFDKKLQVFMIAK